MSASDDYPLNIPFAEAAKQGEELIAQGGTVFFKFTCANCGDRQMFDVPNSLYHEGSCEKCGHVTNLLETGVGYMLVMSKVPLSTDKTDKTA